MKNTDTIAKTKKNKKICAYGRGKKAYTRANVLNCKITDNMQKCSKNKHSKGYKT